MYQWDRTVTVPLPPAAVARGVALVTIAAQVGPADLGIYHLGKILVGPTAVLGRLHVEAEYAMGSYYLIFLAAEAAVFVFFSLFYLFSVTKPGFGTFVAYAFLSAAVHLAIGNFLEGFVPFSQRIWLYFIAKSAATSALALFLCRVEAARRPFYVAAAMPLLLVVVALGAGATIPQLHHLANGVLLAVLFVHVVYRRGVAATTVYLAFLLWNVFIHRTQDFDYRPLADLFFFNYVAWLTVREFALAQAKASVLEAGWQRLTGMLSRFLGKDLARQLILSNDLSHRAERQATLLALDVRFSNRLMRRHGVEATLAALDQWLDVVAQVVARRGGELHKIMGDKALCVWGLAGSSQEQGYQAVAAVVELRAQSRALNERRAALGMFALEWVAAVTSGPVVAGRIGSDQRADVSIFGSTVSRVFALLGRAKDLGVDAVLDEACWAALTQTTLVEPLVEDLYALVGCLVDGVIQTGDHVANGAFQGRTSGGIVYETTNFQRTFVPDRDAA